MSHFRRSNWRLKVYWFLFLLFASSAASYYWPGMPSEYARGVTRPDVAFAISRLPLGGTTGGESAGPVGPIENIENALRKASLAPVELALLDSPSGSPLERRLKAAIVAGKHSEEYAEAGELGRECAGEMKRDPAAAWKAATAVLVNLNSEHFAAAKGALLLTLAEIPELSVQTKTVALRELLEARMDEPKRKEPSTGAVDPQEQRAEEAYSARALLAASAHQAFVTAAPEEEAVEGTVRALEAFTAQGLRDTFSRQLLARYPDGSAQFREAVLKAGIHVNLPTQEEHQP